MKKGIIAPLLLITSLLVGVSALIAVSNNAKPGDSLYTLDRTTEAFTLSLKKSLSKLSYGKYNLTLASERLQEMKALKQSMKTSSGPLVKKAFAQSSELQTLNEYIALLLADISKNLAEAQATLDELPDTEREELSLEIADKTTEYGNDLLEAAKDFTTDNTKTLSELANEIENLDASAVDFLANTGDSTPDTQTETETQVASTLQNKLETKLLRYREELRIYIVQMETNAAVLTPEATQKASALISEITTDLSMVETQLGEQAYKNVSDILDRAHDKLDKLKDLVKVEGADEETSSTDNNSENNSNSPTPSPTNGDSHDNENEDEQEGGDKPSSTPTVSNTVTGTPRPSSTPRPSKTPEPSETPEPTEAPEPTETPEEEVDGAQTQPVSRYSLLRNSLRF